MLTSGYRRVLKSWDCGARGGTGPTSRDARPEREDKTWGVQLAMGMRGEGTKAIPTGLLGDRSGWCGYGGQGTQKEEELLGRKGDPVWE